MNRLTLGLVGALLFAGGGAGLAAGFGVLGGAVRHRSVFTGTATYADAHPWVRAVVGAAGLVVAALALAWLVTQSRSNRIAELDLTGGTDHPDHADHPGTPGDPDLGRTTLATGAVTDAVCAEIEGYPGVRDVSARLVTERGTPALLVFAALDGRTGPGEVRARIQAGAVDHARQALEDPELPARLELRLAGRSRRDIRLPRHGFHLKTVIGNRLQLTVFA